MTQKNRRRKRGKSVKECSPNRKHKHQWRKVGGIYSKEAGLVTRKRCIVPGCGAEK